MSDEGRVPIYSPLVIGYGNPLRADDGFGWTVAHQLAAELPPELATVLAVHQLTPELADEIGRASLVVFVDAHAGGEPGTLAEYALRPDTVQSASFSHDIDAEAVLALAHSLYGRCPPSMMLTVGGVDFAYGTALSPAVTAIMPAVVERVVAIVRAGCLDAGASAQERTRSCTR